MAVNDLRAVQDDLLDAISELEMIDFDMPPQPDDRESAEAWSDYSFALEIVIEKAETAVHKALVALQR